MTVVVIVLLSAWVPVLYIIYRLSKVERKLDGLSEALAVKDDALFSQYEALNGLYRDLGFTKSLPTTRGWAASPDFLATVAAHALSHQPDTILECSSGVSTIIAARCAQLNGHGHVYSLEHDPIYAQKTRAALRRHELQVWATVLDAPLQEYEIAGRQYRWYSLDQLPDRIWDMIVIDGPPHHHGQLARYPAGPYLFAKLAPAGTVFLDDADRRQEQEIVRRWRQEFPAMTAEHIPCEKGCAKLSLGPSLLK
jgi:predicted O-methyltransferase YrrM